ncbi:MAG: hypothetical protein ACRDLV_04715 [Solirubrobacteraceae bacterium]
MRGLNVQDARVRLTGASSGIGHALATRLAEDRIGRFSSLGTGSRIDSDYIDEANPNHVPRKRTRVPTIRIHTDLIACP